MLGILAMGVVHTNTLIDTLYNGGEFNEEGKKVFCALLLCLVVPFVNIAFCIGCIVVLFNSQIYSWIPTYEYRIVRYRSCTEIWAYKNRLIYTIHYKRLYSNSPEE